jgi:phage tail tape-measure protein
MSNKQQKQPKQGQSNFNGPGEYVGYLGGKVGGAVVGSKGGKAGAVVGQEIGGHVGKAIGGGLDKVVNEQSKKIKHDYNHAKGQGLDHYGASKYALDVNGWTDD